MYYFALTPLNKGVRGEGTSPATDFKFCITHFGRAALFHTANSNWSGFKSDPLVRRPPFLGATKNAQIDSGLLADGRCPHVLHIFDPER